MKKFNLPHKKPVRFAQAIIEKDENSALVRVEFETTPSLAMVVESAAQSVGAFGDGGVKVGYLVSMSKVELLSKLHSLHYDMKIEKEHTFDSLNYINFKLYEEKEIVATGTFVLMVP
ncbi:MAG: hypothetical protein U9N42_09310 [Campylobacterota bacterium]|nr:hypothetical protein [Campylobacterota bacterium]